MAGIGLEPDPVLGANAFRERRRHLTDLSCQTRTNEESLQERLLLDDRDDKTRFTTVTVTVDLERVKR